jgi:5-methylcytosine-specific restriction enzyme subunit McrC
MIVRCSEHGPVEIPLDELIGPSGHLELNPEIESRDYFAVHLSRGALCLRARGYVGQIPLNKRIVVDVRPRVPVSSLSRMMRLSGIQPGVLSSVRSYATGGEWDDSLLDLYANGLIEHVQRIAQAGFFREYRRREARSSFPRGRIAVHRTIQDLSAHGIEHTAHVSWFERSRDNGPNRCLKYATWTLARRYQKLDGRTRQARRALKRLNAVYGLLDGVELDHGRTFLDDALVTGVTALPAYREYYRDALNLALAIVRMRAILLDSSDGPVRMPSAVLDMNAVFEGYIRNVLRRHATEEQWPAEILNGNAEGRRDLYDGQPSPEATPDVVIRAPGGGTPLVLEVKNVPVDEQPARDSINQAVTYALCYRARTVVLVHPRGSRLQQPGMTKLGDIGRVAVFRYRFDVGAEGLLEEEERFGEAVGMLLRQAYPS